MVLGSKEYSLSPRFDAFVYEFGVVIFNNILMFLLIAIPSENESLILMTLTRNGRT